MESRTYEIQWVPVGTDVNRVDADQIITMDPQDDDETNGHQRYLEISSIPSNLDQIAAENLIYMAQDGQMSTICEDGTHHMATICDDFIEQDGQIEGAVLESQQNQSGCEQQYFECQVTEEVITDDWVQQQGEERVEIPVDQIGSGDQQLVEELDVPLPTDQDEYTALRPYPCDFCSRRFRKKVSLMNHMIAHQNDRPHICNWCGARYVRRADLLNHLKMHANIPFSEHQIEETDSKYMHLNDHMNSQKFRVPGSDHYYDQEWDTATYETKPKLRTIKSGRSSGVGRPKKIKIKEEEIYDNREHIDEINNEHQNSQRFPIIDERKPFVCQQCGLSFAREKALLSHSRIHGNDSPYECANCNEMFWDITMLHDHQRTHHFEASNSEYEPEQEDDNETETEHESKYGEYYCNICGMSFHRQDLLKRHSKTHIKKEILDIKSGNNADCSEYLSLQHCCNVCGENFPEALDLLAHAEIHARFQPYKCVLCGETFLEEATIKKHLSNVHSNEMTANSCILCGKQCRDRKALIKHAWDHSREKNHSCSKCGKTFHNKARLKRHMVSHRNKSVMCDVCHEEFPDGRSLMNHRHSHSNSSGKLFPCLECGKTFGSRSSQQIHVRIHTGERPYGCRFCWKAFADGGTLRKHERIHTGEKPYACSVCPRAFNQRVVLREHIRSHHSAPDIKRGTYYCSVCSDEMSSSLELIQHLIRHSDMNTAMQRQPITGPRKYKRRRKLKPHELERLRGEKSDLDFSDIDTSNADDILGVMTRTNKKNQSSTNRTTSHHHTTSSRNRKYSNNSDRLSGGSWQTKLMASTSNEDAYNVVFSNLDNDLQNIESLVVNNIATTSNYDAGNKSSSLLNNNNHNNNNNNNNTTTSITNTSGSNTKSKQNNKSSGMKRGQKIEEKSRPKMIHTQKTRVPNDDGKRKTKTLITRTEPTTNTLVERNNRRRNISTSDFDLVIPDILTSTKSGKNSSPLRIKQETSQSDLYDAQLLLEAAATTRNDFEKYNPNVLNDLEEILRSPEKSKTPPPPLPPLPQSSSPTKMKEIFGTPSLNNQKIKNILKNSGDDVRRSSRTRRSVPNRKYLEFETTSFNNIRQTPTKSTTTNQRSKINKNQREKLLDKIEIKLEPIDRNSGSEDYSPIKLSQINLLNNNISSSSSPQLLQKLATVPVLEIKKKIYFKCELCLIAFEDRAQLLDHVPIHI